MQPPVMDPGAGGVVSAILGQLRLYGRQHGYQRRHAASDKRRHYVRARHYDTETAKWMSRDPLGDVDVRIPAESDQGFRFIPITESVLIRSLIPI